MNANLNRSRLRIVQAIFTDGFFGSERVVAELSNALAERHDVLLLVDENCDRDPQRNILQHLSPRVRVQRIRRMFRLPCVILATLRFRADVFHGHLGRAITCAHLLPRSVTRVATVHMGRPMRTRRLNGLILISEWQKELVPPQHPGTEVRVISNWVPDIPSVSAERLDILRRELGIEPGSFVLGFVGRLAEDKGILEALAAFGKWQRPDARFLVIGDGSARGQVEKTTDPRLRYLGYRPDARDLYSLMDCLVVPSAAEPFGLVAVEAMRAGCRVIVSNSHGLGDIAAANSDVLTIPAADEATLLAAFDRAYALRGTPPHYDLSRYDAAARVADTEAFYADLRRANA